MSKCSRCGYYHPGVGQSPDHPVEISGGYVLFWIVATVLVIGLIMVLA